MAAILKIIFTGKKGDFSTPLTGKIVLDSNFEVVKIGAKEKHCLSLGCVSVSELENEANNLKNQLDSIIRTAKTKFPK